MESNYNKKSDKFLLSQLPNYDNFKFEFEFTFFYSLVATKNQSVETDDLLVRPFIYTNSYKNPLLILFDRTQALKK